MRSFSRELVCACFLQLVTELVAPCLQSDWEEEVEAAAPCEDVASSSKADATSDSSSSSLIDDWVNETEVDWDEQLLE